MWLWSNCTNLHCNYNTNPSPIPEQIVLVLGGEKVFSQLKTKNWQIFCKRWTLGSQPNPEQIRAKQKQLLGKTHLLHEGSLLTDKIAGRPSALPNFTISQHFGTQARVEERPARPEEKQQELQILLTLRPKEFQGNSFLGFPWEIAMEMKNLASRTGGNGKQWPSLENPASFLESLILCKCSQRVGVGLVILESHLPRLNSVAQGISNTPQILYSVILKSVWSWLRTIETQVGAIFKSPIFLLLT